MRAGLISRRFGITFEEFKEKLFKPLEEVVITIPRRGVEDYYYVARHPHVAEIVVRNELALIDDLFNEYLAALEGINVGYSSDKLAFQRLLQGKRLASQFADSALVGRIFELARETLGGDDPYLLQQMALYEMARTSGNLGKAATLLRQAMELAPRGRIIKHSLAELHLRQSENARNDLERTHAISEAEEICRDLRRHAEDSYAHSTLVKAGLHRLRRAAESDEILKTEDIDGLIKSVERDLKDGLQRFPGDPHLLVLEADLAQILSESERVATALKQSFARNPRNSHVAWQLAAMYEKRGEVSDARAGAKRGFGSKPWKCPTAPGLRQAADATQPWDE